VLERWLPGLGHLQNLHPLFVHFPIGLIYGAALLYFAGWITGFDSINWSAFWTLILGGLGAAAALATGLYAGPGVMVSDSVRQHLLRHHMRLMIAASIVTGLLIVWAIAARPIPRRGRIVFMAGLLVTLILIAIGADLGAEMVFGYNAGGDACAQPIDFTH
jgi:uncharacterized membrane protein